MFEPFMSQLKALFKSSLTSNQNRQSLAVLNANLRNAANSVRAAQAALARAKAEQQQDRKRLKQIRNSIEDLENRARNALLKGLEPLAREAAEAIAQLEEEKSALKSAIRTFDKELVSLTETLNRSQNRLRALKRGERTAEVREHIQKAQSLGSATGQSSLTQAEEQLKTILQQQERDQLADKEFAILASADNPGVLIEKLADAGCGEPVRNRADDVLARLRAETPLLIEKSS
ncbi:MAG: PspA/IM30 family protein [Pseudomonadota bacterium]